MKKVYIKTIGCKANQFDSTLLEHQVRRGGHQLVSHPQKAEAIILNSCTVTQNSDRDVRYWGRKFSRENPRAIKILTGCGAQVYRASFAKEGSFNFLVGIPDQDKIVEILNGNLTEKKNLQPSQFQKGFNFSFLDHFSRLTRPFFKIQDGCDAYCSFCIIPYARGPRRSLAKNKIISQINRFVSQGYKEVVLTGIHLGKWGEEKKDRLANLVKAIERETGLPRLRLSSIEPLEVTDELLEALYQAKIFCPHFHLPLQSADDKILKLMNRPYRANDFRVLTQKIKGLFPDIFIGLDVLVGFPGEDERSFEETTTFLKDLPWSYLHVFPFSRRPQTQAFNFSHQIPRTKIIERAKGLRLLSQKRHQAFMESFVGRQLEVLIENQREKKGQLVGLTRNYLKILIKGENCLKNSLIRVKLTSREKDRLKGELIDQRNKM